MTRFAACSGQRRLENFNGLLDLPSTLAAIACQYARFVGWLSIKKRCFRFYKGTSDSNVSFEELRSLLRHLGFDERIRGSHHIFTKENVEEILNLQPIGAKAKAYQVKQVRGVIIRYKLAGERDEQ